MGVVKLRRRYNPETREMEDIPLDAKPGVPNAAYIQCDLPDYVSPVTGQVVSGRRQRREDLKRTNSRPFEGFAVERKEAQRRMAYAEQASDRKLHDAISRAYHGLDPKKRRDLER